MKPFKFKANRTRQEQELSQKEQSTLFVEAEDEVDASTFIFDENYLTISQKKKWKWKTCEIQTL